MSDEAGRADGARTVAAAAPVPPPALVAGGILAIAAAAVCMRTVITAVGPVLELIGADTGLSNTMLGLLSALPLLAFAAVSPLVAGPARRIGIERTVTWALAGLAVGVLGRSLPGVAELWLGTAVAGAGIAVCNVLMPVVVRRDFPARIPLMTGVYSATMGTAAALASGVSLPLSHLPGGWRLSLGIWAVPAVVATLVWARRAHTTARPAAAPAAPDLPASVAAAAEPAEARLAAVEAEPGAGEDETARAVWRSGAAWRLTAVMGLQSTTFYILVAWLPSVATSTGASGALAGWYLFAYQAIGIVAGLVLPVVLHRAGVAATGLLISVPLIVACLGIILAPAALPLWVLLAGTSSGSALVYALTRISLAARTSAHATRLSGMAQAIGYLVAAGGPIVAGWLRDTTGSWTPALVLVATVALIQGTIALARTD